MKINRLIIFVVIITITLSITSCSTIDNIKKSLGFDIHDYDSEPVEITHDINSEIALELAEYTRILSIDSPTLNVFDDYYEVVDIYSDIILNFMLTQNFAKYNGNKELLYKADEIYPQFNINTLVPARDYENTVYKYFGGKTKIKHADTIYYTYLEKIHSYTSIGQAIRNNIQIDIISCTETENTYRLVFQNKVDDIISPVYETMFMKRTQNDYYIKWLREQK